MAFTRQFLTNNGVPEDKVDIILGERNRTLGDYILKSDAEKAQTDAITAAVEEVKKTVPKPDVTKDPIYIELQEKMKKMETLATDDFKGLKAKFRDDAWAKLDHEKPYAEQMEKFKTDYPEYWESEQPKEQPKNSPVFSTTSTKSGEPLTEEQKIAAQFREGMGIKKKE